MKKNEQLLASRLLAQREQGISIRYLLRSAWRYYALLFGLIGLLLLTIVNLREPTLRHVLIWGAGMLSGAMLRDVAWFRRIRRQWPFTEKITDWAKVKALAEPPQP